jgi:hypothetical protein
VKKFVSRQILVACLAICTLFGVHAIAGQEGYGTAHHPPIPGGPMWHTLTCATPHTGNEPMVGESYQVNFATKVVSPKFTIASCILDQRPVAPHAIWQSTNLNPLSQDLQTATFGNQEVQVTIQKSDFSAVINFSSGAISECTLN